jgi:ATP adenylyltransferase
VWADGDVVVLHRAAGDDGEVALGDLYVASRRHVAAPDCVSEREERAAASALWLAAQALRVELGPEVVLCAVSDRAEPHFHRRLYARHLGLPADQAGGVDAVWPVPPRGDGAAVASLCARLAAHFPPVSG